MVKLHAGFKEETMMRGNRPAKYVAVIKMIERELNTKPHFVLRVRAAAQEIRKQTTASAQKIVAKIELYKSVHT